jgi:heme-degrading monooxygenase HmoA
MPMIVEHALLNVRFGESQAFEEAMKQALPLIEATPGFLGMELRRCIERKNVYLLLVRWRSLEDHEIGFRQSERYQRWRDLLHHFYEPFPEVFHFGEPLIKAEPGSHP